MTANKRLGARWKGIVLDWNDFDQYSEEKKLYWLSDIEASILIAFCEYVSWQSRWITAPPNAVDLRSEMEYDLMTPVDLCQLVADCISNPDSPANAAVRGIADSNNGYPANERLPDEYANSNAMEGLNPTCDQDTTFGMCRAVVQMTNQLIEDFLEKFEATTNYLEIAGIVSGFPVLDELGLDVLTEYTSYMQSVLAENYSAQYTTDLENEMACGLFCLSQETCSLSVQQISDYFNEQLTLSLSPTALFEDLITALIGAPLDGNYVVYSLYSLVWTGLRTGNIVLGGVGDKSLRLAFSVGAGDPSDDWLLLCEDCSDYWEFTVTATNKPSWLTFQYGTLTGDTFAGVYPTNLSGQNWTALKINWTFPAVVELTQIRWKMVTAANLAAGSLIFNNDYIISKNNSNVTYASANMVRDTVVDQIVTFDTSAQLARYGEIQAIIRKAAAPQPEFSFELTFAGNGYNPFE